MPEGGSPWDLYRLIFETWRFQVDSYWTRAAYFAIFETGAVGAIVAARHYGDPSLARLISFCGLLFTVAWWMSNRRTHQYVTYWWHSLQELEPQLTEPGKKFGLTSRYDYRANLLHQKRFGLHYHIIIQSLPVIFAAAFVWLGFDHLSTQVQKLFRSPLFHVLFLATMGTVGALLFLWVLVANLKYYRPHHTVSKPWLFKEVLFITLMSSVVGITVLYLSHRVLEPLSDILAVLAIMFAIEAHYVLYEIRDAVPTRFIGSFPEYLSDVAQLVREARTGDNIYIMADCADNGSFTNPGLHRQVIEELTKRARNSKSATVECLIWGESPAPLSRSNPDCAKPWEELARDTKFQKRLLSWIDHNLKGSDMSFFDTQNAADLERFLFPLLLAAHDDTVRELKGSGISVMINGESTPNFFLWLVDERRAVFMLTHEKQVPGTAFYTQDPYLVGVLKRTFEAYLRDAKPYSEEYDPLASTVKELREERTA